MAFQQKWRLSVWRLTIIFVIFFIATFPFPYNVIPDFGSYLAPFFKPINQFWIDLFGLKNVTPDILSDSTGLYVHLITLFIISLIGSVIWWRLDKLSPKVVIWEWFHRGIAYYLALTLLIYGFNKVFKWQFYFPEPNTLFTYIGQMTPDILYWSALGSSYPYSIFSGIIEIIPAFMLLFKRTRLFGGFIALMVLINVVMINFGFDISVKIYSIFLLSLSVIIILPNIKSLWNYFSDRLTNGQKDYKLRVNTKLKLVLYSLGKPVIIAVMLFEVLLPYVRTQNFNDDLFEKPYLNGAYKVQSFKMEGIKKDIPERIFIHRRGYFIIEYSNGNKESFDLEYTNNYTFLQLKDFENKNYLLSIERISDTLSLSGIFKDQYMQLVTTSIALNELPIKSDHFHWTIDTY